MEGKKYIYQRSGWQGLVFLAQSKEQVQEFLHLTDSQKHRLLRLVKNGTLIDFNLINFRQFEHTPDRIPFTSRAQIRKDCRFCKKTISERIFFGKPIQYECWHCVNSLIRKQVAQISDQHYQLLEGCCGQFVTGFIRKLNKNIKV